MMSHDPLAGHGAAPEGEDIVVLPSSLTIVEVGDVKRQFTAGLANGRPMRIDCSALDAIDGAGLQLLAAVARTANERQIELRWQSPPPMLGESVALIGLGNVVAIAPATPVS